MKKNSFLISIIALSIAWIIFSSMFVTKKPPFRKCMNIGNALEAPKDIPWDVEMKEEYFDVIKEAGFDSVRIPVRFSDYANKVHYYILDEEFMKKIDYYINYALNDDLTVILDFHHFVEIMEEPEKYKQCFLSIWNQLSERYKDYSSNLIFEVLNEPRDNLSGELWNDYLNEAIEIIRKHDAKRKLIVGPDNYYSVDRLYCLSIPKDSNIIVSFHYYEPNTFTFQGDEHHEGYENLKNIKWTGSDEEINTIKNKFNIAEKYGRSHNAAIFLGEFGANKNAPQPYRKIWTECVRKQSEDYNFAWGYWELCSSFGIYDRENNSWDEEMLQALLPNN